jgi:hypothetical protein
MAATQASRSRTVHPRLPGVHLDWRQPRPSAPLQSGIALFIGFVHDPAPGPARAFTRWESCEAWLDQSAHGHLDYAVRGFFENGGFRCWVLALPSPDNDGQAQQALLSCLRPGGPLDDLWEPDLICLPDAAWRPQRSAKAADVLAVQTAALDYCRRLNDRLAILDCLPAPTDTAPVAPHGRTLTLSRLPWFHALLELGEASPAGGGVVNGAQYWPWVRVAALPRHGRGRAVDVPPCGHIAGVYARLDARDGRHKAPANEPLEGVFDVDEEVEDDVLAELNDDGVNSLRALPGRGVLIGGARLLSNHPDWRYINVRRVVLGLARWSEAGLADLVMEPLQPALWERIRQRLDSYCLAQHRAGALQGGSPQDAYFVKCDAETNPRESIEQGRVVCNVGLAITTPAEFIVVQLVRAADSTVFTG